MHYFVIVLPTNLTRGYSIKICNLVYYLETWFCYCGQLHHLKRNDILKSALENSFIISFSFPWFETFMNSLNIGASWMLAGIKQIYYCFVFWGVFFKRWDHGAGEDMTLLAHFRNGEILCGNSAVWYSGARSPVAHLDLVSCEHIPSWLG